MDQSWCPVCDRAIEPKRVLVAAASTAKLDVRNTTRAGQHGLVHGTGRVKPGGQLKPVEQAPAGRRNNGGPGGMQNASPSLPPAPPSSPTVRTTPANRPRVRTVISEDPTPLYCSDACRDEDASRLAQCLSPLSALSSSRCSSSPRDEFDLDFFSGSESASSPGEALSSATKQAPKLTGFTPVRPRSPPHKPNPDWTRSGTMAPHNKFEEAASRRKPMPPPRSPAAIEEHPFDPRMPPGWRPHEYGQWRKVMYGDFSSSQRQRPTRQNSTPTSPSAVEHSHSTAALADSTPVSRAHRNSLPALNDMTVLYDRYNSDMSARRASRELHASSTLLERTPSSSTVSTFTSLSSRSNSMTSIRESTPATTVDSDSDDMSKGFALGGGARTYSSLARIGSASALDTLAPPPVPTRSDSLAKLADRDRERERRKHATSTEAATPVLATTARTLSRRAASANDVQAQSRDAQFKLPTTASRTRTVKRVVRDQVTGVSEEREVEQTVMQRRPLFTFASARA